MTKKIVAKRGRPLSPTTRDTFAGRLGDRIRAERQKMGITIEQASAKTGGLVSGSLWGYYEKGTEPRLSSYLILCMALGINPEELLPKAVRELVGVPFDFKAVVSAFRRK